MSQLTYTRTLPIEQSYDLIVAAGRAGLLRGVLREQDAYIPQTTRS